MSPFGEMRTKVGPTFARTLRTGYSSRNSPSTRRTTASYRPSGDQSAEQASSTTGRNSPPSRGTRARVPIQPPEFMSPGSARRIASSPREETLSTPSRRKAERAGRRAVQARREDLVRVAIPERAVDDGVPIGREPSAVDGAAAEGERL